MRPRFLALTLALSLAALLAPSAPASAGWQVRCVNGTCYQVWVPDAPAPSYAPPAADASAFLPWLNGLRASRGLPPVAWDQGLAYDAAINNTYQQARGLGHFYMGSARRQNAAMAPAGLGQAEQVWLASPAHLAAMLDPTIRAVGLAGAGAYWTMGAR